MTESADNLSQLEAAREAMGLRGAVDADGTFHAAEATEAHSEEADQAAELQAAGEEVIRTRDQFVEAA